MLPESLSSMPYLMYWKSNGDNTQLSVGKVQKDLRLSWARAVSWQGQPAQEASLSLREVIRRSLPTLDPITETYIRS